MNRSFLLTIAVVITLLSGCAYYNILFNAKKNYEEGVKELLKNPDETQVPPRAKTYFEATIDKCWKLIDLFSENSKYADDALLYICKSEYYLQKYTQAKLHLEQFRQRYPDSKLYNEASLWYGKVLIRVNEFEKADEQLRYVINTSDDSKIRAEAHFELGSYEFEHENYDKAVEYYLKALEEKPDDHYKALLQYNLGEAFYMRKDYENAIGHFKKVEDHDPSLDIEYRSQLYLAKSLIHLGRYENAHRILRRMLTAPRFSDFVPTIKAAMGENYERQQRYEDAVEIYKETVLERKQNPGTAQAAFNLARIYENIYGNVDSAVVYYGKVASLYNRFDSLQVAKDKEVFLRELKDIRDEIRRDKYLVYKLETDPFFRDSLYQAQHEDSLREAYGIGQEDTSSTKEQPPPFPDLSDTAFVDTTLNQFGDSLDIQIQDTAAADTGEDPIFPDRPFPSFDDNLSPAVQTELTTFPDEETSPESISPVQLEKRKLPEIKRDLMHNTYELAEYYLLKVANYDSAEYHLRNFLSQYEDSVLTPKALYSLRFIHSQPGYRDSVAVDSLESIILNRYPESAFAREIMRKRGMLVEDAEEDSIEREIREMFLIAESLYFDQRIDDALRNYERVAEIDTTYEWGAKALYATAWIYEKELNDKQLALNTYEKIIERYPDHSKLMPLAKKKITPPSESTEPPSGETGEQGEPPEILAIEGDTIRIDQKIDTPPGEDLPERRFEGDSQTISRDKIIWRMRRNQR